MQLYLKSTRFYPFMRVVILCSVPQNYVFNYHQRVKKNIYFRLFNFDGHLQYILSNGAYDNQEIIQIYLYLYHSFHTSSESDICECCFKRLVNLLDI